MKQGVLSSVLALLLLGGCISNSGEDSSPEFQASLKAKQCYEALYDGRVETFLNGREHAAEMPQGFRQQLLDGLKQHVREVDREHKGVRGIEVTRAVVDSTLGVTQVFLCINYGDGSLEEIVVPMVGHDKEWHMK